MKFTKNQGGGFNKAGRNSKLQSDLHKIRYLKSFRVSASQLEINLQNFKMVDPIWRTKIAKYYLICSL